MSYTPQVNDYVIFGEQKAYGVVQSVNTNKSEATIVGADGKQVSGVAFKEIEKSAGARMSIKAMGNGVEILENTALMALYNGVIAGRSVMGAENVSFLSAELVHEFGLKGMLANWFDMLSEPIIDKDATAIFKGTDFTDPLRKLPFVFAIQQLTQKFLYKKPLNHSAMHNLLGGYSAMTITNAADRMFRADKDKKYAYP